MTFQCPRCAEQHETILACPYVKAVEFADGVDFAAGRSPLISRVEFLTPRDYGPAPGGEKSPDAGAEDRPASYATLGGEADRWRASGAKEQDRPSPEVPDGR